MTLAFGPLVAALAVVLCAVSVTGFVAVRLPLAAIWAVDGAAKLSVGLLMWNAGQ